MVNSTIGAGSRQVGLWAERGDLWYATTETMQPVRSPQEARVDQSMRAVLAAFERSGDLHYVDRPVDPRFELGAVLALRAEGPTQLFRKVVGHRLPVVGNLLNTRAKIARALDIEPAQVQELLIAAVERGLPPELVERSPLYDVVHGAPVDVAAVLPVPTWFERERGPYITAGVIVAKDIESGRRNVSIARLRVEGGDRLMAGIAPTHHLAVLLRKAQARGRPLEIAVSIGNHPAVLLASQMYSYLGHDEYEIAGGLLGEPLRLVRCQSVDLEVPAASEIVIEGTLHADERVDEGPVSEFPGFYVRYGPGHGVRVQTIARRTDAIYQAIAPGYMPEHCLLGGTAIAATLCRALRQVIPAVRRVTLTDGGMGRLHAIISMHQPRRGEGKRAILLALGQVNLLKLVIVVDDDIDPEDWRQVEWALAARMRADRDIFIVPGVRADRCEPLEEDLTVAKVGIVATTQPGDGEPGSRSELARAPREVLERVRRELDLY
jgi:2,5-furandicarboxylate decarboxylase 1